MTFWDLVRNDLKKHISNNDIKNWRNWSRIRDTMYPTSWVNVDKFDEKYNEKIDIIRSVTNPKCIDEDFRGLLNQLYNIQVYTKNVGKNIINYSSIIEYGGGFGGLYRVLTALGFNGEYTIIDLPELIEVQKEYLNNEHNIGQNIKWVDTTSKESNTYKADLFWATWSLSECVDRPLIEDFDVKSHMIAYANVWDLEKKVIDNKKYFSEFMERNSDKFNFSLEDTRYNSTYLMSYEK